MIGEMQRRAISNKLVSVAWLVVFAQLIPDFVMLVGMGMSPAYPHVAFREACWTLIGPLIAPVVLIGAALAERMTWWRFVAILVPLGLTLLEIVFAINVWSIYLSDPSRPRI